MEHWRSFFHKAGEDLWTIIEQAILLAAHDHPGEFKEKRCDLAEILFARRVHQGDADAARLSASVVTNCTNRMADEDEARGEDEHLSAHTREAAEEQHTDLGSAEARDNGVENDASISQIVCNIKETLDGSMQSDAVVLHGLQTLQSLLISVDVLKATEIGKQVNNLRKHSCKEIRLLAKGLVRHWKQLVDDWVNGAGASHGSLQEGHATSERDSDEGMHSASQDKSTQILKRAKGEVPPYCHYDTKARENYLEAPEERGSSSRPEVAGSGRIEKRQYDSRDAAGKEVLEDEINVVAGRLRGGKDSHGTLASGQPSADIMAGNGTELSGSYRSGKASTDVSRVSKLPGDDSSQKQKQSRLPTLNHRRYMGNAMVHSEDKLQASKRKLQEAHTLANNAAKRQNMAMPANNLEEFPMGGPARAKTAPSGSAPLHSHWR